MVYKDRLEAGKLLSEKLIKYKDKNNLLVLGIPRGGVVVAVSVADHLNAQLDIVVTRKIGHPENPEYAVAAVDEDGDITRDGLVDFGETDKGYYENEIKAQKKEIKRRLLEYRGEESHTDFKNKICLIVDDGIATGLTTLSAIKFVKKRGAKKVILAVPVIPKDKVSIFEESADELVYLDAPEIFFAVGQFYESFPQTEDGEVVSLLRGNY